MKETERGTHAHTYTYFGFYRIWGS